MEIWLILIVIFLLYWLPSVIAFYRSHHQTTAIFVLNLMAGWTFIGWVAALVWAFTRVQYDDHDYEPPRRYRRLR